MTRAAHILGIVYGGHDTAAALMSGGKWVAACEEERYSREKHSRAFPNGAIADCLKIGGLGVGDLSAIAFTLDPYRYIQETYLRPGLEDRQRIRNVVSDIGRIEHFLATEERIRAETGFEGPVHLNTHHLCHLASTYYPSGFDEALLVSIDGLGEIESGFLGVGRGGEIEVVDSTNRYPDSLGLLYSAITFYLGWRHHCDEGIIMGLAPYGDPMATIPGAGRSYYSVFEEIVQETGPYSYTISRDWISYHEVRDKWVSDRFYDTLGPRRDADGEVLEHHKNVAAALQRRLEEVVLAQLARAREEFGLSRLCLSGGVALNCSMNGKIESSGMFDEIFVQPASGDSGTALGACCLSAKTLGHTPRPSKWHDFYLGSRFSDEEIESAFEEAGLPVQRANDIHARTAQELSNGKIVGWFQGGAEFGPRALGNRSILCRPYPQGMRDHLNARVKFREYFRPFAPAVLAERAKEYFDIGQESPHMLIACKVLPSKKRAIPAVVHVDDSCRVQTVTEENNAAFRKLIEAFHAQTGVPVVLNTSFNVKGQPIVNTPLEAIECFLGTNIDYLAIGDYFAEKSADS